MSKLVLTEEARAAICSVKNKLRITKTVATRSVKGRAGDHYVGFSAAWDTIQDDAGGSAELITAQAEDQDVAFSAGMTLKESKLAAYMLGMQADIVAHQNAAAGGSITPDECNNAVLIIKGNYSRLMAELFLDKPTGE